MVSCSCCVCGTKSRCDHHEHECSSQARAGSEPAAARQVDWSRGCPHTSHELRCGGLLADIMSLLYMPWDHAHSALVARRSVAITTGTSVDCRRLAPNSQKDCLLSYIASILQGPSGSAGACWASTPHAKAAYIPLRGGGFDRYMGHYVFMHFAPSFLPSRAARVTRIPESSSRRMLPLPRGGAALRFRDGGV